MITVSNLSKSYGGQVLYQNGSFFIGAGEKVGLVGPNGAGKTSLFRLIMGEERADTGTIDFANRLRICYFSQSVGELKGRSAIEEVIHGNPRLGFLKTEISKIEKALEEARKTTCTYVWLGVWEENHRAKRFYSKNGFVKFDTHIFKMGDDAQTDWMMKLGVKKY